MQRNHCWVPVPRNQRGIRKLLGQACPGCYSDPRNCMAWDGNIQQTQVKYGAMNCGQVWYGHEAVLRNNQICWSHWRSPLDFDPHQVTTWAAALISVDLNGPVSFRVPKLLFKKWWPMGLCFPTLAFPTWFWGYLVSSYLILKLILDFLKKPSPPTSCFLPRIKAVAHIGKEYNMLKFTVWTQKCVEQFRNWNPICKLSQYHLILTLQP